MLAWAADAGRVLVTHDVQTITRFAFDRVRQGLSIPGVFELSRVVCAVGGVRGRLHIEAAEAVCNPPGTLTLAVLDGIAALADQSFVQLDSGPDGARRFTMLETIRAYAQERLDAGGAAVLSAAQLNARCTGT